MLKHNYYIYVTLGYTGRFIQCSKKEFDKFLEMAKQKFILEEALETKSGWTRRKYYAYIDYGVNDGTSKEWFATEIIDKE